MNSKNERNACGRKYLEGRKEGMPENEWESGVRD